MNKDGEDVIEFLLLGSSSIQVCTEVMLKGYGIVNNYHRTLASYMDSKGYESLEQMIGKGLHLMKDFSELDFQNRVVAEIDPKRCTKCRKVNYFFFPVNFFFQIDNLKN